MRDLALIIHFVGLAMGLGTSFAFMFLGIKSTKMEKQEGQKFQLNILPLSRMGHIGLFLLILSGFYLMIPYGSSLAERPLLIIKLVLVLVLLTLISFISRLSKKIMKGNPEAQLAKMGILGKISLLITLTIVVLAVLIFH